ncbi:uncharacterized protein [Musca autumnalis]|uniref:uncharacterized protein n=1 Tax=Musca autumnalis TaxID=221902 RepID=UPI003CF19403
MEDLGKMAATLPEIEDNVPMSDEERELDASAVPLADSELPQAAPSSKETKNPLSTVPEAPSGETVATPPLSAPRRKNQGSKKVCVICDGNHFMRDCKEFLVMRVERRLRMVALHKCCGNCLSNTHSLRDCTSRYSCKICNKGHHTLLHQSSPNDVSPTNASQPELSRSTNVATKPSKKLRKSRSSKRPSVGTYISPVPGPLLPPQHNTTNISQPVTQRHVSALQRVATLGPTMVVQLLSNGLRIPVRALLDPCAGHSLICRSLADSINLCHVMVGPERFCQFSVASSYDGAQQLLMSAHVVDLWHLVAPSESVSVGLRDHYAGLQLADPRFNEAAAVSMIIGPDVYHKVMRPQTYSSPGFPWAQLTIFGWVISGPCNI